MHKSKLERHVKDSFLNPIRPEPGNWQKIYHVLKEEFLKKTFFFLKQPNKINISNTFVHPIILQ